MKPTRSEAAEASSVTTGAARLLELANTSVALARKVAGNPSAPVPLLETLAFHADKQVRRRVAANPTTPAAMLMAIGGEFPEELFDNPSLDLYLFENPNLFDGIGVAALRSLLKRDRCPPSFFAYAARQDDEATHLALLANANAPRAVVEQLTHSKDEQVRETASRHIVLAAVGEAAQSDAWRDEFAKALESTAKYRRDLATAHHALAYLLLQGVDGLASLPWAEGQVVRVAWTVEGDDEEAEFEMESASSLRHTLAALLPKAMLERIDKAVASHDSAGLRRAFVEELASYPYPSLSRTVVFLLPDAPTADLARAQRSSWWVERCAIAQAAHVPRSVLERLTRDAHAVVRAAAAWRASTPWSPPEEEVMPEPPSIDWRAALTKALKEADPGTIAAPPSEAVKAHEALAYLFWGQALRGVAMTTEELAVVTLAPCSPEIVESLAANPATPEAIMEVLARHPVPSIRAAVATGMSAPGALLDMLTRDPASEVRAATARNPITPVPMLQRLARDDNANVRTAVVHNPAVTRELVDALARDENEYVRWAVASQPSTPEAVLERMSGDTALGVQEALLEHAATPRAARVVVLEKLASHRNPRIQMQAAEHPETPPAVLDVLSRDREWTLRMAAAGNPSTPVASLDARIKDGSVGVREALARNPMTSEATLAVLAHDKAEKVRHALAQRGNAPKTASPTRVTTRDPMRDAAVARHLIAANPATPAATLATLAMDPWRYVRRGAAGNPATPVAMLERLAQDRYPEIRRAVARNPSTPLAVLECFGDILEVRCTDSGAVEMAWGDPVAEAALRATLCGRIYGSVRPSFQRAITLRLPDCPEEALSHFAGSAFWVERCVVAQHAATPDQAIAKLCRDPQPAVRAAAIEQQAKRAASAPVGASKEDLALLTEAN